MCEEVGPELESGETFSISAKCFDEKSDVRSPCIISIIVYWDWYESYSNGFTHSGQYSFPISAIDSYTAKIVSGDTSAKIDVRPHTEKPTYSVYKTDGKYFRVYNASEKRQMAPDIHISNVHKETVVRIGLTIKGHYAETDIVILPEPTPTIWAYRGIFLNKCNV